MGTAHRLSQGLIQPLKFSFAICIALSLFLSGCGVKAPPKPAQRYEPPAINNLSQTTEGNKLTLSWSLPQSEKTKRRNVDGFIVQRSILSSTDCQDCPQLFTRVADIPAKGNRDLWQYSEILTRGYRYTFKVSTYSKSMDYGVDSNSVTLTY